MDRVVIDALNALPEGRRFMKGLFAWVGFRTATIDYRRESRVAGTSKFNAWKLWNFALEGIASFSISPLKVWTYIGVLVALAAMVSALLLPRVANPIKLTAAPKPPSAIAQFFTRNVALVNHSSLSRAALGFVLVAILVQWPVLFSVGYFSHDELQWLSFAQRP